MNAKRPEGLTWFPGQALEKGTVILFARIDLPPLVLHSFALIAVFLVAIGTLFLAYDLLGRENGPLRWFTLVMTCGIVSTLIFVPVVTVIDLLQGSFDLSPILSLILVGGLMGFYTVILVELPPSASRPPIFSWKGSLLGLALALAFWLVGLLAGPQYALPALALGLACALLTSAWQRLTWEPAQAFSTLPGTGQVVAGEASAVAAPTPPGTRQFEAWKPAHPKPHVFSRKGFWTGLVAGFVPWLLFIIVKTYAELPNFTGPIQGFALMIHVCEGLFYAGLYALANAVAGSIAQYTLWRANTLPHRTLGAIGLVLIIVAFGLQGVQPMIEILNDIK
jgi:hypothetical protein